MQDTPELSPAPNLVWQSRIVPVPSAAPGLNRAALTPLLGTPAPRDQGEQAAGSTAGSWAMAELGHWDLQSLQVPWGALGSGGTGTPGLALWQCWGGGSARLQPVPDPAAPDCSRPPGEDPQPEPLAQPRPPCPAGSAQSRSAELAQPSAPRGSVPSRAVAPGWAGTGTQLPQPPWPQGWPRPVLPSSLCWP